MIKWRLPEKLLQSVDRLKNQRKIGAFIFKLIDALILVHNYVHLFFLNENIVPYSLRLQELHY